MYIFSKTTKDWAIRVVPVCLSLHSCKRRIGPKLEKKKKKKKKKEKETTHGCGSKLNRRGYASVGPCFHLPGFHFGTGFLSLSHMSLMFWKGCSISAGLGLPVCNRHAPLSDAHLFAGSRLGSACSRLKSFNRRFLAWFDGVYSEAVVRKVGRAKLLKSDNSDEVE